MIEAGIKIFAVLVIVAGWVVMVVLALSVDPEGEIPVAWRAWVVGGILLLFAAVAGVWFFIIYDIVHAARNPRLSGGAKAGWIWAICFLNVFAIPAYWAMHLRRVGMDGR
jgi:hypothetical protein